MTEELQELIKTVESLRTEVRELRKMVNVLVEMIINQGIEDQLDSDYERSISEFEIDYGFSM